MSRTDQDDRGLDAFFEAARRHPAEPGAALHARLLAEAEAAMPAASAPVRHRKPGWLAALGGWPALTGLVTATVAGVWIGVAQPVAVGDLAFGGGAGGYDFSGLIAGGYVEGMADG